MKEIEQCKLVYEPNANMIFVSFPRRMHQMAFKTGAYYDHRGQDPKNGPQDETLTARMVCDWSIEKDNNDQISKSLKLYEYKTAKVRASPKPDKDLAMALASKNLLLILVSSKLAIS